jgi:hypothetical protein
VDTAICKMGRINAGPAVQFQDVISRMENAVELVPDNLALGTADERIRERIVIGLSRGVEANLREATRVLFCGTHASTSFAELLNPS